MTRALGFGLILVSIVGCASVVKKPEVNQVQKAAIISLYANPTVPRCEGNGSVKEWNEKVRGTLADSALRIFTAEMARTGWRMTDGERIVKSSEYQEAFKNGGAFAPAGMAPIDLANPATR